MSLSTDDFPKNKFKLAVMMHLLDDLPLKIFGYCRIKANCPLAGPGTVVGVHSIGVYLRDPRPYLSKFLRKPRKIPND